MNLIDALQTLKSPVQENAVAFSAYLACGFTPLHVETFLRAHLRKSMPLRDINLTIGIYGDLSGNLERAASTKSDCVAAIIEWQDLDPRLGIRNLGGWRVKDVADIVSCARRRLSDIEGTLREIAEATPAVISFPTLPLPPLFYSNSIQSIAEELELRHMVAESKCRLAALPRARIISAQAIDEKSPMAERMDVQAEILSGFPYKVKHASVVAEALASLIQPTVPKKGLITDLDDTLWAGLVGEIGANSLSWHLEDGSHIHGLFQQFLASLASSGTLVAVASKNDPEIVQKALERNDLLLPKDLIFPVAVTWSAKSESVREILRTWNVGAESVVFVDDSPLEVAEVKAAFPEMECRVFPKSDYQAAWQLLLNLRNLFGKPFTTEEDQLRMQSIRGGNEFQERLEHSNGDSPNFLASVNASISFSVTKGAQDRRSFELINKTNQFNLNGRRITESEWLARSRDPGTLLMSVTYEDKFGALGKIAAILGHQEAESFVVDCWVMSCRAFSRQIEYACLKCLFQHLNVEKIVFRYEPTSRNSYLQEFFVKLLGHQPAGDCAITREEFEVSCPELFHQVKIDD